MIWVSNLIGYANYPFTYPNLVMKNKLIINVVVNKYSYFGDVGHSNLILFDIHIRKQNQISLYFFENRQKKKLS